MFEFEIESEAIQAEQAPDFVRHHLRDPEGLITSRTILEWGEHCTECAAPGCFSTCDFYAARSDGKCRRFLRGTVRVEAKQALYGYLTAITFKKWGKLWAPGHTHLFSLREASRIEYWHYAATKVLKRIPFRNAKFGDHSLITAFQNRRRAWVLSQNRCGEQPSYFLLEVYAPESKPVDLTIEIRPESKMYHIPFLKRLSVEGFRRFKIPVTEITALVDLGRPFDISIIPNTESGDVTLFFGVIDFVHDRLYPKVEEKPVRGSGERKIKAVIWDLDNTFWEGILIEDGLDNLRLKPGIREILQELDERGILLSIASKNNPDDALTALEHFGLKDFFLYPQVSWGSKAQAVRRIAERLNIGLDTFAFVDDSPFERAEVASMCPEVLCLDAKDYRSLCARNEFDVVKTKESAERRQYYQAQIVREEALATFDGDYFDFLRSCGIELTIQPFTRENIERVYELTQRTNQMNFSGNRYTRSQLEQMLHSDDLLCLVLTCSDKFGTYGAVGFSVIRKQEPRMVDLMFSCRVQSKRVEHAYLTYVLGLCGKLGKNAFFVDYRKTKKNEQAGRVFDDFGFEKVGENNGVLHLSFPLSRAVPNDGLIKIMAREFPDESSFKPLG